jgi:hypothetical protein
MISPRSDMIECCARMAFIILRLAFTCRFKRVLVYHVSQMRMLAGKLPGTLGDLLMPWVSVEDVADAAVCHALGQTDLTDGKTATPLTLEWAGIRDVACQLNGS